MDQKHSLRKNPSKDTCTKMIRRILMTEFLEEGKNCHFKQPSDFMSYFESLYPASDSLTKQVQRAVKSMNLPRDHQGFYIINKSSEQIEQDEVIKQALQLSVTSSQILTDCTPVLLKCDISLCGYLKKIFSNSITLSPMIDTIVETNNGLLLYTHCPDQLILQLSILQGNDIV